MGSLCRDDGAYIYISSRSRKEYFLFLESPSRDEEDDDDVSRRGDKDDGKMVSEVSNRVTLLCGVTKYERRES